MRAKVEEGLFIAVAEFGGSFPSDSHPASRTVHFGACGSRKAESVFRLALSAPAVPSFLGGLRSRMASRPEPRRFPLGLRGLWLTACGPRRAVGALQSGRRKPCTDLEEERAHGIECNVLGKTGYAASHVRS